jgi:cysteinyl-tRNA synthetase
MTLTLYNTLTRRKEPFRPIDPANVRMYVCGPTVYDYAHIGNARPVIVFDVLFRLLRHLYGPAHVTYARNITDVDDKINARAVERYPDLPPTEAIAKLTAETTEQFHKDIAALGVLMPEQVNKAGERPVFIEPRATQSIAEMRTLIESLVANGHAYVADNHVLFDVPTMPDYGRLANRSLEEMEAGARVDVAPYKKGPMDFVLWKPSKPGEPAWPSPAGIAAPGRPGWHIECSAMADRWLWQEAKASLSAAGLAQPHVFDIHGGGIDLVFPHHENEVAQSRCGYDTPVMANYWMHNGFLQVEGQKMSKSLGNFVTINELLQEWPGDVMRLQMLMTHYRQPIDWTESRADLARDELEEWGHVLDGYYHMKSDKQPHAVIEALSDDLNTPNAVSVLRDLHLKAKRGGLEEQLDFAQNCKFLGFRELNRPGLFEHGVSALNVEGDILKYYEAVKRLRAAIANGASGSDRRAISSPIESGGLSLNIDRHGHINLVQGDEAMLRKRVGSLIAARSAARKAKNFKEADRIRDELAAMGIQLKDAKDPATGEIVTRWDVKR